MLTIILYVDTDVNANLHFTNEEIGDLGRVSDLPWSLARNCLILVDSHIRPEASSSHFSHEQHCLPSCNTVPWSQ